MKQIKRVGAVVAVIAVCGGLSGNFSSTAAVKGKTLQMASLSETVLVIGDKAPSKPKSGG